MPPVFEGVMRLWFLALVLSLTSLSACGGSRSPEAPSSTPPGSSATAPPTSSAPAQGLLQITALDVLILESYPPQIRVKVEGTLPDGCSEVGDIVQQRNGKTIDVTIPIKRTTTGPCIAIAPQVSRTVALEGSFVESGTYIVRVNGQERTFAL
jgi:hypothetical protein